MIVKCHSSCIFVFMMLTIIRSFHAQLRNRPRGLGLLHLPTGITDERSGPFLPNLYIAGDKAGQKPQTVSDVSLAGQKAVFSGGTKLNLFTHAVAATYNEDLNDSWGAGYAVQGTNIFGLNLKDNYDSYAALSYFRNDGSYQPFFNAFAVGAEYDLIKICEVAVHTDIPVLDLQELFDFDAHLMSKTNGGSSFESSIDFPLVGSYPVERFPFSSEYLEVQADRHMQYGHVLPNVNQFQIPKNRVLQYLRRNRANPKLIG